MSRISALIMGAALSMGTAFAAPDAHAATTKLRFATLAPKNSSWGKLFKVWQRIVRDKTGGRVELEVYFNAVQGDEPAMVAKMQTGQIDGAALSATGLSLIHRDVLVLQLPGVVNSWPLLDLTRALLKGPMEMRFEEKGFRVLGWGDIGLVRMMSKGFAVRGPKDLRGRRPLVWRNEPIGPMMFSLIGGVVPIPLGTVEIGSALRAGTIDVISAPALAAEQLQWVPFLDHVNDNIVVCAVGATVLRKKAYESVPADLKELFNRIQRRAIRTNRERIRKLDASAHARIKRKMKVVHLTDDDKVEWYRVWLKSVKRLRHGVFSRELIDKVLYITGKG